VIHLEIPVVLVAVLAGAGVFGILARRNAVLVLIGVELVLNAANLLLVTAGARLSSPLAAGPVLTLFVITIAAAEVVVALAIVLVMFRRAGHIDLTRVPDLDDDPDDFGGTGGAADGSEWAAPVEASEPSEPSMEAGAAEALEAQEARAGEVRA
jgi:NADH-quinone oxidoreductase subunit K